MLGRFARLRRDELALDDAGYAKVARKVERGRERALELAARRGETRASATSSERRSRHPCLGCGVYAGSTSLPPEVFRPPPRPAGPLGTMRLRASRRDLARHRLNPRNEGVHGSNPRVGSPDFQRFLRRTRRLTRAGRKPAAGSLPACRPPDRRAPAQLKPRLHTDSTPVLVVLPVRGISLP
jgi:hypothetical protein